LSRATRHTPISEIILMEFRHNVNDTNDFERQLPQSEQLQPGTEESFPELGVTSEFGYQFFDPAFGYGHDGTDTTHTGLPSNMHEMMQEVPNNHLTFPAYDDVTSGSNIYGNDITGSGFGYHDAHGVTVNGYENLNIHEDILRDLDMHDGEQTFNATSNFTDPYLHQHLPQFGSGDLADRSFHDFAFDDHTHAASTAPLPIHTSGTFTSPAMDANTAQAIIPPSSPPTEPAKRTRRRRPASMGSRDTPEASRLKKQCAGCDKNFYTSKDPEVMRCSRCYDKHVKHTAGHRTYVFDPEMTIDHAWRRLYPEIEPLALPDDDVEVAKENEQDYIRRLAEAVSLPYSGDGSGSKEDQQRMAQQAKLNKKPFDSIQYRDDLVNARIRFLFHIALSYHRGGPSLYDTGGDNSGYGEDRTMKFSERIERIIQLLTFDKDIAMDVIEGRGVTALVHNPNKYERRKRDNKKSNDTKQDLQEKGKQLHILESGASASPAPVMESVPGQRANLQAHMPGNEGEFAQNFGAFAPAHSPFSALGLPSSGAALSSDGNGGGNAAVADSIELDGYIPAPFR
jgi:hypothetical protein